MSLAVDGTRQAFTISVSDNGPGIPEHERERVFERFVRLENERNSPGNGLGLSLVKAITRLHTAQLTLEDNNPGLIVTMHFTENKKAEISSTQKLAAKQIRESKAA